MKFCSNPLCLFHLDCEPSQKSLTYQVADKALQVRSLNIVQAAAPPATPRQFQFCEICANVLALTFGKKN